MVDDEGLGFGWLEGDLPLGTPVRDGVHCFLELCCRIGYAHPFPVLLVEVNS